MTSGFIESSIRGWLVLAAAITLAGCTPGGSDVKEGSDAGAAQLDYEEAARYEAGPSAVYVKLAVAYMRDNKLDVAVTKIKQAIQIEPGNPQAENVAGLIYERLGENKAAEQHYRAGIRKGSGDPYLRNAYGAFLCRLDRFEEAEVQFAAAWNNPLYNGRELAYTNAGLCARQKGDIGTAETYLRQALRINPRIPQALAEMGEIRHEEGDYLGARAYLQRYEQISRHTAATLWLGVQIERELGDRNSEASYAISLRNQFPDSDEVRRLHNK
ncbi:MAG: type IV pilus biogenesis/stability protein PilW [Gammaproteobacteria bacterium]|nr:type IV pilus biogenesis/stability protein PilW [Gammaproteobacteria bacterium]